MKKYLIPLSVLALLGAGCFTQPSPAPTPAPTPAMPPSGTPGGSAPTKQVTVEANVEIKDTAFSPKVLAVKAGTTVVWTNTSQWDHTVAGTDAVLLWDSGNLKPGQQYTRTFDQPGTYKYHCGIHPEMTGEIVVGEVIPETP